MGGKSERFIMRLDGETLDRWKVRASVASTSVAGLIIQSMEGQAPGPSADDLSQATQQIIKAKDAEIAALQTYVATLKRELAKRPAATALQAMKRDPAMKAVEPAPDGKSLLPAALRVPIGIAALPVQTRFPPRPVYQRGQTPAKGKNP